jgi:flavoprotein hydroxylase
VPDPIQDPIHDVAIVGFGPVGQTSALLLGRLGYDVVVLERWPQPYPLPRAVHFDHEIGRIFQAAGVADEVAAIIDPVPDFYEWHAADGRVLLKIDWSGLGPCGWPTANFFSQPQLEQVLSTAVAALPNVTVLRGHEVVQLREHDDHITLTATSTVRKQHTVRARYVIGADGANSFVRQHMSTSVTDRGFFFDWLIVDTVPHEEREWSPMNWQLCDPARPTTIVSGGPGRRRWEFLRLADETIESLNTLDTAWRLLEPWGRTPTNTTIERHAVYTFQARWADRWHQGRLLLAGDAAHLMPPFAGQGMCSGLRDAVNLAWKLDLVLRGRADEQLLDTYTTERSAHVQHAIQMSISLGEVICVLDPERAEQRNQRMVAADADPARALPPMPPSNLVDGIVHRGPDGLPQGIAGALSPQFQVSRDGRTGRFDDVIGNGFALLTADQDPSGVLSSTDLDFVISLGHVVRLAPSGAADISQGTAIDVDDGYLPYLAAAGAAAVIVRPDFYVYGGVTDLADLPGLVAALRNDLTLAKVPTTPGA